MRKTIEMLWIINYYVRILIGTFFFFFNIYNFDLDGTLYDIEYRWFSITKIKN